LALPHSYLLPRVLAPSEVIGQIQPDIAAHFGINPQCFIHAGTTDSTAAFIASGIDETGVGVTTLGTTLVLKQLSAQRIEAPEYGVYSHRYGELWLVGGASNAGAGVLGRYFDNGATCRTEHAYRSFKIFSAGLLPADRNRRALPRQ